MKQTEAHRNLLIGHVLMNLTTLLISFYVLRPGVSVWSASTSSLVKAPPTQPSKRTRGTATCAVRRAFTVSCCVALTGPVVCSTSSQIITIKILWATNFTTTNLSHWWVFFRENLMMLFLMLCFRTHQSFTPQSWWRRGSPSVSCRYLTA